MSAHRVLVIGGGVAGIAAAAALRARDIEVVLVDRHRTPGGRARSDTIDGMTIDLGAQLAAASFEHVRRLVEAHATVEQPLRPSRTYDVVLRGGTRHPLHFGSVTSLLGFGALRARDKLMLGARLVPLLARHRDALEASASALPPDLDSQTARSFFDRQIGPGVADLLGEPPLNSFYGARSDETSLAFFLTLGRYGTDGATLAPAGGWSAVLRPALDGAQYEPEVEVAALDVGRDRVRATSADGREWTADAVVIACGPVSTQALLAPHLTPDDPLLRWLAALELRAGWTLALALDTAAPRDVFGIFPDSREQQVVSGCAIAGAKAGARIPPDRDVVLAWAAPSAAARLAGQPAAEIVEAMLPEIQALVPATRGHVTHARLYRFDAGTPLAQPGFGADRAHGRRLAESLAGPVALAGDYLTMPLLEGAVISGERAAQHLAARLGW